MPKYRGDILRYLGFLYLCILLVVNIIFWIALDGGIVHIAISSVVIVIGYIAIIFYIDARRMDVLDRECDPERYIELLGKKPSKGDKLNIALAYSCLGQDDAALAILQDADIALYGHGLIHYHLLLLCIYMEKKNIEAATQEYEKIIRLKGGSSFGPVMVFSIDIVILDYHYRQNETSDTAKLFLEQLRFLYNVHKKCLRRRQKVFTWFLIAELLEKIGDINGALVQHEKVATKGNKLYVVKLSQNKIAELQNK